MHGRLTCEGCYDKATVEKCSVCGQALDASAKTMGGKKVHPQCASCAKCNKKFAGQTYYEVQGNAYCAFCAITVPGFKG